MNSNDEKGLGEIEILIFSIMSRYNSHTLESVSIIPWICVSILSMSYEKKLDDFIPPY